MDGRVSGRVLALDPSTRRIGWAVFDGGRYVESGSFRDESDYGEYIFYRRFDHIVIEAVYFGPNVTTLKALVEVGATCKVLAMLRNPGVRTWEITAHAWQVRQLGIGRKTPRARRKTLSKLVARDIAGRDVTEDEADAINLGDYFVRYGGIDGRFEKGAGAKAARKAKRKPDRI